MILTYLFQQRLQYFQAQIPQELLRGEWQRILELWVAQWTSLACTFCFPISDHVMFPREFSFWFYISYACICTCRRRHLKETFPWSNITWSEMGKQNVQAKEVHWSEISMLSTVLVYTKYHNHYLINKVPIGGSTMLQCTIAGGWSKGDDESIGTQSTRRIVVAWHTFYKGLYEEFSDGYLGH